MLYIKRGEQNDMVVTVSQHKELSTNYFLFSFEHILSKEKVRFYPQNISTYTDRFDEFRFVESENENLTLTPPYVTFPFEGDYYYSVYQMSSSATTNPSFAYAKLEEGRAYVSGDTTSGFYTQFISDNDENDNYIFLSDAEQRATPEPTPTQTTTPTPTPTYTPTPSCSVTTQYMGSELVDGDKIRLTLWDDDGLSITSQAVCDYEVSGQFTGTLGTIYSGTRTFPTGDHQIQYNFTSELQSGETISWYVISAVTTTACACPVVVNIGCENYRVTADLLCADFDYIDCNGNTISNQICNGNSIDICAQLGSVRITSAGSGPEYNGTITDLGTTC